MLTWLAPLVVFGLVVFIHELGHFLAAKAVGVYAPVFSIGWGTRAWGIKVGETEYRLSWFPIGGFVSMASREDEMMAALEGGGNAPTDLEPDASGPRRGFAPIPWDPAAMAPFGPQRIPSARWIESKPTWARVFVLSAGVLMNIVLALVVATGVFAVYGRPYLPPVVAQVLPGKPAQAAGLQPGDTVVAVDGTPMRTWSDLLDAVGAAPGREIALSVHRAGGAPLVVKVTPQPTDAPDPATGIVRRVGRIGAAPPEKALRQPLGLAESAAEGWRSTWQMGFAVAGVLKGLFSGAVSVKSLGGPIAIARTSVAAAKTGLENLLALIAFLSINIAILNLLPIPLLDGGQIVLAVGEGIRGRAFSVRTREAIARVGIVAVGLLFVVVMWNDLTGLFRR